LEVKNGRGVRMKDGERERISEMTQLGRCRGLSGEYPSDTKTKLMRMNESKIRKNE